MSFKPEIQVIGEEPFYRNGVTFATHEEAEKSAYSLFSRWMIARDYRVAEVSDEEFPVNYKWVDGEGDVPIEGSV